MTVSSTSPRIKYDCNGSTTDFTFTFNASATDEISVILTTSAGVETTLTENSHYFVTATNNDYTAGGTVSTCVTGDITTPYAWATGYTLTIMRVVDITQETDLVPQPTLYQSFENALDKCARIDQQLQEQLDRTPKFKDSSDTTDITFPEPEANKIIGWNAGATDLSTFTATATNINITTIYQIADYSDDLDAAITDIGSNEAMLLINETADVNNDVVVPTNVHLWIVRPGVFSIDSGKTLTIYSPTNIIASFNQQIFTGSGTVVFSQPGVIYPDWWKTNTTPGTTDMHDAFELAVACAIASGIETIHLNASKYYFGDTVTMSTAAQSLRFTGLSSAGYVSSITDGTCISGANGLAALFTWTAVSYGLELDHIRFNGVNKSTGVTSALKSTAAGYPARPLNIHNCHFENFDKAIYSTSASATGVCQVNIENNTFHGGNYALYADGSYITIQDLKFTGNVSEAGAAIYMADGTLSGTFIISDNMMEANSTTAIYTIRLGASSAHGEISRNYFEEDASDVLAGNLIYFKGSTGSESLTLKDNYYALNAAITNKNITVINAKLTNYDMPEANLIKMKPNLLTSNGLLGGYHPVGNYDYHYQSSSDTYIANTLNWQDLIDQNYTLSSGFYPTYQKTGDGTTFTPDPSGKLRGYVAVSTDSSAYTITDAGNVANGDWITVIGLFKRTSSTTNKWVNLELQDNAGTKIGEIGESLFYPFYRNDNIVPFAISVKATATSTGTYKLIFKSDADAFWLLDFYVYHQTAASAANGFYIRYPDSLYKNVATIAENGTSVTVTHGMPYTPYAVHFTPSVNVGYVWVDTIGATQFVINCSSNSHAATTVYWEAY
jgi:hypothetical protein